MNGDQEIREINIEGLKPFAKGGTGECFRLDEDLLRKTIVIRMIAFDYLRGHKYEHSYVSYVHDRVLKIFG